MLRHRVTEAEDISSGGGGVVGGGGSDIDQPNMKLLQFLHFTYYGLRMHDMGSLL